MSASEGRAAMARWGFDAVEPSPGRIADTLADLCADLESEDTHHRADALARVRDLSVALDAYSFTVTAAA